MAPEPLIQLTMALTAALLAFWAVRVYRLALISRYRILFVYLVFSAALWAVGLGAYSAWGPLDSPYLNIYLFHRSTDWALSIALMLEIYSRAIEVSPAISRAGKWFLNPALALALLAGVGMAAGSAVIDADKFMRVWAVYEESYYLGLLVMSVLMIGFLLLFRVKERRNVLLLGGVFGSLFGAGAVLWLTRSPENANDFTFQVVYIIGLAVGGSLMSKDGEKPPDQGVSREMRNMEQQLVKTMQDTTRSLGESARKGRKSEEFQPKRKSFTVMYNTENRP